MYYYNPWNLDYKQPFGAVKVGQAILLKFDANQTQVEVKCIIRRDFGKRYEFLMSRDESGFLQSLSHLMKMLVFIFTILKFWRAQIGNKTSVFMGVLE